MKQIKLNLVNGEVIFCDIKKFEKMSQEDIFKLCKGKAVLKVEFEK